MGEFTNGDTAEKIASQDTQTTEKPQGIETDVPEVYADGEKQGLPVFKVTKDEFYQNMNYGRKRLRFKSGTAVQKYMQNTKYKRPFWIQNAEDDYIRKIK